MTREENLIVRKVSGLLCRTGMKTACNGTQFQRKFRPALAGKTGGHEENNWKCIKGRRAFPARFIGPCFFVRPSYFSFGAFI